MDRSSAPPDGGRAASPRREQILKEAARLFAERGYHAVGMTELQEAVHLGRGALYHHIQSKEELLYRISKGYISDLVSHATAARKEPSPPERIRQLGRYLVLTIASHQPELTVCFREVHSLTAERRTEVLALHAEYERVWRDTMVEGAEAYCFRPYDPIVLKGILGMYYYSYLWMHPGGNLSAESIADRFNDLALRMLAADAPAVSQVVGDDSRLS